MSLSRAQGKSEYAALVAGSGQLPAVMARAIKERGHRLLCIPAVDGAFTDGEADAVRPVFLGNWGHLVHVLQEEGVSRVYFAGKFERTALLGGGPLDDRFQRIVASLQQQRDSDIVTAFLADLEKEGFTVGAQADYLSPLMVPAGVLGRHEPEKAQWADVARAFQIAKAIAQVDAGQTAVVKGGAVLALEAVDGTDATIRRGGRVGGADAVAVKVAKPHQDPRFDVPVLGLGTVRAAAEARLAVLAFEAGATLVLDKEALLAVADQHGIALVAFDPTHAPPKPSRTEASTGAASSRAGFV